MLFDKLFNGKITDNKDIICGGKSETLSKKGSEIIKSENIVSFEFQNDKLHFKCELNDDKKVHITASGGKWSDRDGTAFKQDYTAKDNSILTNLQKCVKEHKLSYDNGHTVHVAGLPGGLGDMLSVKYDSGETIYRYSNQFPMIDTDSIEAIYKVFLADAQANGYDFTTRGSSAVVYDDPNELMLQGEWKGEHFGRECRCIFTDNHVQIYYDGILTDDTDYIIIDGAIMPNILRSKPIGRQKMFAYEFFNGMQYMTKSNNFTLTAHFYIDKSSSSIALYNFDKTKR